MKSTGTPDIMTSVVDQLVKRPLRLRFTIIQRSQKTAYRKSGEKTSTKANVHKTPILKPSSSAILP